jgi:hypothetical protein
MSTRCRYIRWWLIGLLIKLISLAVTVSLGLIVLSPIPFLLCQQGGLKLDPYSGQFDFSAIEQRLALLPADIQWSQGTHGDRSSLDEAQPELEFSKVLHISRLARDDLLS